MQSMKTMSGPRRIRDENFTNSQSACLIAGCLFVYLKGSTWIEWKCISALFLFSSQHFGNSIINGLIMCIFAKMANFRALYSFIYSFGVFVISYVNDDSMFSIQWQYSFGSHSKSHFWQMFGDYITIMIKMWLVRTIIRHKIKGYWIRFISQQLSVCDQHIVVKTSIAQMFTLKLQATNIAQLVSLVDITTISVVILASRTCVMCKHTKSLVQT